jgi:hypothetical protein
MEETHSHRLYARGAVENPLPNYPFFREVGPKGAADRNLLKKNLSKDHKLSAVLTESGRHFYDSHSFEINPKAPLTALGHLTLGCHKMKTGGPRRWLELYFS